MELVETEDLRLSGVEARLVEGLTDVEQKVAPVTSSISSNRLSVFLYSPAERAFLTILYNLDPTKNCSLLG